MKIKNDEEIDKIAIDHANKVSDPDLPEWHGRYSSFKTGAKWMQSDLLESASEGYQKWFLNNLGEPTSKNEFAKMAWQAATLAAQKEINELKDSVANLEFLLEGWQKDYKAAVKDIKWLLRGTEYFRNDMREYCKEIRERHGIEHD